mmetsp:Transcript_5816/g.17808  ORF Transcript_5816/g.17808 Transcript_5816/m.17808 type:complete len:384 (+) Transcript_5816:2241-3392(+)
MTRLIGRVRVEPLWCGGVHEEPTSVRSNKQGLAFQEINLKIEEITLDTTTTRRRVPTREAQSAQTLKRSIPSFKPRVVSEETLQQRSLGGKDRVQLTSLLECSTNNFFTFFLFFGSQTPTSLLAQLCLLLLLLLLGLLFGLILGLASFRSSGLLFVRRGRSLSLSTLCSGSRTDLTVFSLSLSLSLGLGLGLSLNLSLSLSLNLNLSFSLGSSLALLNELLLTVGGGEIHIERRGAVVRVEQGAEAANMMEGSALRVVFFDHAQVVIPGVRQISQGSEIQQFGVTGEQRVRSHVAHFLGLEQVLLDIVNGVDTTHLQLDHHSGRIGHAHRKHLLWCFLSLVVDRSSRSITIASINLNGSRRRSSGSRHRRGLLLHRHGFLSRF